MPGAAWRSDAVQIADDPALRGNRVLRLTTRTDGTLAGSTLTMDQALRNLVAIGLPLEEASARVSRHAADYLRLADRGRLAVGAWADLVLLDARTLQLQQVCIEGEAIAVAD